MEEKRVSCVDKTLFLRGKTTSETISKVNLHFYIEGFINLPIFVTADEA